MAGTWLDTVAKQENNYALVKHIRAYDEGVQARLASNSPTNPHTVGTPESDFWIEGAADAAAGEIDPSSSYRGQTGPV